MPHNTPLVTPTVHMNGTGFSDLWDGYTAIDADLHKLADSFSKVEFNARDYYVQGPEAYTSARDTRYSMAQKLRDIQEYVNTIRMALDCQRPPTARV